MDRDVRGDSIGGLVIVQFKHKRLTGRDKNKEFLSLGNRVESSW